MTLIAVTPAKEAYVMGADSQETCPYYDEHGGYHELRKSVQKIEPKTIRNYQVAIAGTGNASLIDSFIVRAHRTLENAEGLTAAQSLRELLENELSEFHGRDVALCPDQDKGFTLLIAYCCIQTKEFGVWKSANTVLCDVRSLELVGDAHELYAEMADRLMAAGMTISQAILATLHVLTVAEATSNSIRGPHSIAVIRENGIWMDDRVFIEETVSRIRDIEAWTNHIMIACADTSFSPVKLHELLAAFSSRAEALHQSYIQRIAQLQVDKGLHTINDSYSRLPPGTILNLMESGPITVQCDVTREEWEAQKYPHEIIRPSDSQKSEDR